MKLTYLKETMNGSTLAPVTVPLCKGAKDNTWVGVIPSSATVGVEDTDPVEIKTNLPVEISSDSTRNGSGKRRIMIRVATRYQAPQTDSTKDTVTDTARSGGEISAHIVLSLPAATETDLKGVNGAKAARYAAAQVAHVAQLLAAAAGPSLFAPKVLSFDRQDLVYRVHTLGAWRSLVYGESAPQGDGIVTAFAPDSTTAVASKVRGVSPAFMGMPGVDVDSSEDEDILPAIALVTSPWGRGLNNLAPLCGDTELFV